VRVEGVVAAGYETVRQAVAGCGPGVAVAALVEGRRVVDVWTDDLSEGSLLCTWSAVKPVTGACLLTLVERGRIGLDDPVVSVWPELADDRLLVRHLLTHTAGRVTVPAVPLMDWDQSVAALAAQPPDWAPGRAVCEHAQTFGHLVGEVVRRVDRRSLGRFLREELAGPLGLDIHIGLGPAELARARDTMGLDQAWWSAARGEPGSARYRAMGPWVEVNDPTWRRAEIPAVNGFATARGLASFWLAFLDGRLPTGVGQPGVSGHDLFVDDDVTWTLAGGRLDGPDVGMGGLGGQWAAARPSLKLAWAFLTNRMGDHDRAQRVEDALVAVLEE
jgi:CubicO group peptidase (beta-lactamase class C family)